MYCTTDIIYRDIRKNTSQADLSSYGPTGNETDRASHDIIHRLRRSRNGAYNEDTITLARLIDSLQLSSKSTSASTNKIDRTLENKHEILWSTSGTVGATRSTSDPHHEGPIRSPTTSGGNRLAVQTKKVLPICPTGKCSVISYTFLLTPIS